MGRTKDENKITRNFPESCPRIHAKMRSKNNKKDPAALACELE